MRVEVAGELEDELEGELGAAGKGGEAFEVGDQRREGLHEVGGGQGVVECVLEAVQVVVHHGHFAVELEVEGLCAVGEGVHCFGDVGGDVWGVDSKYVCRSVGVGWEMGLREVEGGGAAGGGKVAG